MKEFEKLIQKYNKSAPRYTSYPALPFWSNQPSEEIWIKQLKEAYSPVEGVDLYVHIPFCESLCYYCGCHRVIRKSHEGEGDFIDLIKNEWNIYKDKYGFNPVINSIHFGGGTPTFLSPDHLFDLITFLTQNKSPNFFGSIEVDPRTCQLGHLKVFKQNNICRVSLGIQDFDETVQKLINRFQTQEMIQSLVQRMRENNVTSINFDLIYGLPGQTLESIKKTIKEVIKIKPDLIAFYSYAHLPDKIKNQKLIPESTLPAPGLKRELFETGKDLLIQAGYMEIGLDHFALPDNFLAKAKMKDELHRNFMGHIDTKTNILIGLGPSSISDSTQSYLQNIKNLKLYENLIDQGLLPIEKGHVLTKEDQVMKSIIMDLICKGETHFGMTPPDRKDQILQEIRSFYQDGLVELNQDILKVTEKGRPFIRNVAMCFDLHMKAERKKAHFSQTL